MDEITLDGEGGRSLTLRRVKGRDSDGGWSFLATLTIPEGTASTEVWDYGDWLGTFMADLALAWRGFEGTKEYQSCEGQLRLACRHDGLGTVNCTATLRSVEPSWSFEALLRFGAGAHLEGIASDLAAFVDDSG